MIWLTWRQFRPQAVALVAGLALLGIVLALTGPALADDYASGIATCGGGNGCHEFAAQFFDSHKAPYFGLVALLICLPGALGLFWGAPLVARELEAGTHRLAWNQSVTRRRWLAVKLGLVGLVAVAAAGLASLAVSRWSVPLDHADVQRFSRLSPVVFDARGIVPVGYAAFAFVLGVAAGILLRRTVPAMAVTLVTLIVVQVGVPLAIRPHLVAPATFTTPITAENVTGFGIHGNRGPVQISVGVRDRGAWILSNRTVDAAGKAVDGVPVSMSTGPCAVETANQPGPSAACFAKIEQLGYRQRVSYQPAGRYWALQWRETALFLVLAGALAAVCFRRIRRLA